MNWISACSAANGCVEVTNTDTGVLVHDSKDPDGPRLAFTRTEWDQFIKGAKEGVFDLP